MKNYVQDGDVMTFTAPTGGVVGGDCYKIGDMVVCATFSADEGQPFEGKTRGVISGVPKTEAQAWAEGQRIYWNEANKLFTTASSGGTEAGFAAVAALNPSTTGSVRLSF